MAEMHISSEDINGLAQTLEELDLPEGQKALLSAIVALAADAIGAQDPEVIVDVGGIPSIADQFAVAFTPDQAVGVETGTEHGGVVRVGVGRVGVSRTTTILRIGR